MPILRAVLANGESRSLGTSPGTRSILRSHESESQRESILSLASLAVNYALLAAGPYREVSPSFLVEFGR